MGPWEWLASGPFPSTVAREHYVVQNDLDLLPESIGRVLGVLRGAPRMRRATAEKSARGDRRRARSCGTVSGCASMQGADTSQRSHRSQQPLEVVHSTTAQVPPTAISAQSCHGWHLRALQQSFPDRY